MGLMTGPHACTHPTGSAQPQARRRETGPGRPPPPKQAKRSTGPGQDTRRGTDRVERPYQRPAPAPREVCAPHQPGEGGGGADAAGARAHTDSKDTRGKPEGQPDRARGMHRPHGMAYQRARIRDTPTGPPATHSAGHAGREGENGEDTTPNTGPKPPGPAASAAHTQPGHLTRQGSSGALGHAPAPRLGSLRASPRGSRWRQASSTGPAAPAPRATTHKGGNAVCKRPQPRLRIGALTGEWRNREAGEGRGSQPCEPGGLRHQAGGVSWRAPH